jgi:predicted ATPase
LRGVGKTRLALQAAAALAEQFTDGVFVVSLASVTDPEQVGPAIMQTLSIGERGSSLPFTRLAEVLKDKDLLLVLDNFEQVVEAALQVTALLSTCPKLRVLVTSRAVLHLQAEREFVVPPLSVPAPSPLPDLLDLASLSQSEAVAFFIERTQAVTAAFQVTNANAPIVAAICARLDGLPLALELAAARTKYFSPPQLLRQLDHALAVLSQGARDLPVRQQTLRRAIAWSYQLLTLPDQQLFRRLAVFVDGCSSEGAAYVCTTAHSRAGEILEGLLSLRDKSLLWQEEQLEEHSRFRMLQVMREFGLECLEDAGETETTREAHAAYYLALAERAFPYQRTEKQKHWQARLEQEHANLRAALSFLLEHMHSAGAAGQSSESQALRLCLALSEFWRVGGYFREALAFFERALAHGTSGIGGMEAEALYQMGRLKYLLDDYERAQRHLTESLTLYQAAGEQGGRAACLTYLGLIASTRGEFITARARLAEAEALCQEIGDSVQRALCLIDLARLSRMQGEYSQAQVLLEESLRLYQAAEDRYVPLPLTDLALLLFVSNQDLARAWALAEQCLAAWREMGEQQQSARVLSLLGRIQLAWEHGAEAQAWFEQALAIFREIGDRANTALVRIGLARVAILQGEPLAACRLFQKSLALLRETGGSLPDVPAALEGWGIALASSGELARAVQLWGAASAQREALGTPMPPVERAAYERAVGAVRIQIGEKTFAEAMVQGRRMTLEEILSAARPAMSAATSRQEAPSPPTGSGGSRSGEHRTSRP